MNDTTSCLGPAARLAALVIVALPLQGCTLAAYGLGVATMVNDSTTRQSEEYAAYVKRTEAENAKRLKAGQPAEEILPRRAWSRQGAAP